jgi:hypothetical protein
MPTEGTTTGADVGLYNEVKNAAKSEYTNTKTNWGTYGRSSKYG